MGYIALIVVGALALGVCVLFAEILRSRERNWARREQLFLKRETDLMNRIMYLSDRPWDGPDVSEPQRVLPPEFSYPDLEVIE